MNIARLKALVAEYREHGLYVGSFESLQVSIHRQIDYANNVLLVEAEYAIDGEALLCYSVLEEAIRCLYWSRDQAREFLDKISADSFPVHQFQGLYATHFRNSQIFDRIRAAEVEEVIALANPAYDDWRGEFFIRSRSNKYVLMWDYCD